jgi:hypothetical protein
MGIRDWLLVPQLLRTIIQNQENTMAAIDDLIAADAAETAELATVQQALTDEITRVNAALSTLNQSTDPQVAAVTADLHARVANLQTIATVLAGVAPVAPATN